VDHQAVVALFLYSLLPIIRNTHAGLNDIPSDIKKSAEALGLSSAVDFSVATKDIIGKLTAYRWAGEKTLANENFVYVDRIDEFSD